MIIAKTLISGKWLKGIRAARGTNAKLWRGKKLPSRRFLRRSIAKRIVEAIREKVDGQ